MYLYIKNTKTVKYKTLNKEMIFFIYLFILIFSFFWGGGDVPTYSETWKAFNLMGW